jgi:NADH-quinone oxidoreductase subunit G
VAAKDQLKGHRDDTSKIAIVLSAQHSNEDNFALYTLATTYIGAKKFYMSGKPLGMGDSVLMSEDKNPNTRGVMQIAEGAAPRPLAELLEAIEQGRYQYVIALGSELEVNAAEARSALGKLKGVVTIASHNGPLATAAHIALPACSWAEVDGTYVNRKGLAQRSDRAIRWMGDARPAWDLIAQLGRELGYAMSWKSLADVHKAMPPGTFAATAAGRQAMPPGERPPAPLQPSGTIVAEKKPEALA